MTPFPQQARAIPAKVRSGFASRTALKQKVGAFPHFREKRKRSDACRVAIISIADKVAP
jgi:hypothetical protein